MKRYLSLLPMLFLANGALAQVPQVASPQDVENPALTTDPSLVVPAETIASCQLATQELGNEVIKENYLYALDKMYPRYKNRQVAVHGEQKFKQVFLDLAKTLNNKGITITSFKADTPVSFFRVWPQILPAAKLKIERGEQKDVIAGDVYHNWLVMVPTTQVWTFTSNKGGPPRKLKRVGFQIAVAKDVAVPGQEEWTFIDGGTIEPQDLRAMFPSLPQKIVLPNRTDSEIK
ncbi:MAG: hypothetical protein ACSHX6_09450 [Akkermansiaceae bacterium]